MGTTAAVETALAVAPDHPAYEGHFPGHPILPGVVILAEVLAAIEAATARPLGQWEIASAKFLAPVTPGAPLTLRREQLDSGAVRFEVRSGAGVVASGTLVPRSA
jgi:3-hydroxymyristoyl/3-hydroxydecanoyl-(acyl carrier protein) dehydratase